MAQGFQHRVYHLWYSGPVLRKRGERPLSGQRSLAGSARPVKRVPAIFFRTEAGGEPIRDWLKSLPSEDRKRIGEDIKTVEFGWPLGMPLCRPLGDGIHEVRTEVSQNRIARLLFYIDRKGA